MNGRLVLGDAMSELGKLADGSVDLVVTDPPYRLNYTSGSRTSIGFAYKWTNPLSDLSAGSRFKIHFKTWLPEVHRVLAPRSHCYVFTNDKNLETLLAESRRVGLRLHNVLVWLKNNKTPNRWYMKDAEFVAFLHKGKSFPIRDKSTPQVLRYASVPGKKKIQPTEKPVPLLEKLVANSSESGALVLDPFAGSGSTAEACERTGRRWLSCEIDRRYYARALRRLELLTASALAPS